MKPKLVWFTLGLGTLAAFALPASSPAAEGDISTFAGTTQGLSGDGGLATAAQFDFAHGVAIDASGNVFIADINNDRVRKVDASTGIISTFAGTTQGLSGDGGPATAAQLNGVYSVAVDASGNVFIADHYNDRIRKVDASTGIISAFAGTTTGFGGDGGPATAAQLDLPYGVAVDATGNVFIADQGNHRIRMVDASTGVITTFAGTTQGLSGDGGLATAAQLNTPTGVAVDTSGNVFIAEYGNHRIRKVRASTGIISTFAGTTGGLSGDGGPATSAQLNLPVGVAVNASGNVFIADTHNHRIRKVEGPAKPKATPTAWATYYAQANSSYAYFSSIGQTDTGLAYWFYFRAYGDQAYYKSAGYPGYAQFKFYEGLGYFYYTFYKDSAPNLAAYFLYLYFGYAYYDYLVDAGDPAGANSLYSYYYALALSVL